MKKQVLLVLLILIIFSCINKSNKIEIVKTYYEDGSLSEVYQVKSKFKDGLYLKYFSNGNLQIKCFYKNGLKNGKNYSYFTKDWKINESEYRNDTLINEDITYYYDGKIKFYYFRNIKGEICYYVKYDVYGNKIDEFGCPFPQVVHQFKLRKTDTLFVDVYVVSPPKTSSKVLFLDRNGSELDIFTTDSTKFKYSTWFTVPKKGFFPFSIKRFFYDSIDNKQIIDTINSNAEFY